MISGGVADDRHAVFLQMYEKICGKVPIILLHTRNDNLTEGMQEIAEGLNITEKLQLFNVDEPGYGYLNGVSPQGTINTLCYLAKYLGYECPPQFDRTVRAMILLAKEFNLPGGLAGFSQLAEPSYAEFRQRIGRLGGDKANALAYDMEVSGRPECYYLFQAVIQKLAYEARANSWNSGRANPGNANKSCCIDAINNCSTLLLEMQGGLTRLVEQCICSELKEACHSRFLLVTDGIPAGSPGLAELLNSGIGFKWGIIAEDAFSMLGEDYFASTAEKAETILLFKHRTGVAAQRYSELIGRSDVQLEETSEGTAKETFKILPGSSHKDVRYTTENRYRVMPEEIMDLDERKAIIFDTNNNQISRI